MINNMLAGQVRRTFLPKNMDVEKLSWCNPQPIEDTFVAENPAHINSKGLLLLLFFLKKNNKSQMQQ